MGEQPLRILKTEPLEPAAVPPPTVGQRVPLSIAKTEPLTGGRGGGPGTPSAATGGRGGQPGGARAASPPPAPTFYPGGWKAAGQDAAGMAGGIGAAALVAAAAPEVAPVAGIAGVARMLPVGYRMLQAGLGIAGAGAGGGAAAALQGAPLDIQNPGGQTADEDSVVAAFKRQATMEAEGLGTGWGLGFLGRRVIASRVGQYAREWLDATRAGHMDQLQRTLQSTQDAIRAHAETGALARQARTTQLTPLEADALQHQLAARGAEGAAKANTTSAAQTTAMIPGVRKQGAADIEAIRGNWPTEEAMVAPRFALGHQPANTPPPNFGAQAARQTAEVVSGPAQRSLNQLGQAVEGAAESGPRISMAPIKAKLQAMHAKTQLETPTPALPALTAEQQTALTAAQRKYGTTEADFREAIGQAGVPLEPDHPLPGVLNKVMLAGDGTDQDMLAFSEAHKLKRALDDAINWAPPGAVRAPARGQIKQIVKGVRGQLRDSMNVHAPYAQATAAYKDAATLFGPQGLARKIQAAATANPDALVNSLVKVNEPEKFQMLREVLTDHAAAGGDAEAGQHAWQAVQSTVMYKHLIAPGLENFEANLAKMHPEFRRVLLEDPHARGVFNRLSGMADAVKSIEGRTQQTVEALGTQAKNARNNARTLSGQAVQARGRQAVSQAQASTIRVAGKQWDAQHAVEGQELQTQRLDASREVTAARAPTAAERAFDRSSLASPGSPSATGSDLAYAAMSPAGSPRQVAGVARLLLKGPKVNDLIRWASLSPTSTQMFVRAVTGPAPKQAIAAMIRLHDWMGGAAPPEMAVGHKAGPAATPPPGPRR